MNVKRFAAKTSREAFALVRQAFGDDAVVLSTRPAVGGVEVLAMASGTVEHLEQSAAVQPPAAQGAASAPRPLRAPPKGGLAARAEASELADRQHGLASEHSAVAQDAENLAMSTLSFQDYVRERMLKRRQAALAGERDPATAAPKPAAAPAPRMPGALRHAAVPAPQYAHADPHAAAHAPAPAAHTYSHAHAQAQPLAHPDLHPHLHAPAHAPTHTLSPRPPTVAPMLAELDDAMTEPPAALPAARPQAQPSARAASSGDAEMMSELRAMKGLIEERFGALAFMEKLQRSPRQALLAQRLLDAGWSPGLIRKLVDALPAEATDEMAWAAHVLERNLATGETEPALEEQGGVYALIGSTGVGKTTSTAKLAAAFATQHGAANLGLVTLDAYRVGAQEQLRAYGRILGVPVHTAHDRASLEDLLDLLAGKRMVLIDTAGMAQRDARTRELLEMLSHRSINRLLVLDAAAQGETLDDVILNWRAAQCKGVVLSKIDEAVKLAPALDAVIRHKLQVLGVANGQRVPEDWHRLSANALLQRALRGGGGATWRMQPTDVQLVFAQGAHDLGAPPPTLLAQRPERLAARVV